MDRTTLPDTRRIDGTADLGSLARKPVYYFDLAPILERSNSGLSRNPERLQSICQHSLACLAEEDIAFFVEGGFYVVFSSCAGDEASTLANRINISLRRVLFGTDSLARDNTATMFRLTSLAELKSSTAAVSHIEPGSATGTHKPQETTVVEESGDALSPEERENIRQLATRGIYPKEHVQLSFVPVYDLKRDAPAHFFCTALANHGGRPVFGYAAFGNLRPLECAYVDHAILRYAVAFAGRLLGAGSQISVGFPISAETLGWSRGRQIYQAALRQTDIANNSGLIPLLDGLSPGTPPGRIADLLTAIRPFVRRAAVLLPDCEIPIERGGAIGAAGYALALPKIADSPTAHRAAFWLARACLTQNAFSCLTGVHSQVALDAARSAGIRFAAGSALAPRALTGEATLEFARAQSRAAASDLSAMT